MSNNHKNEIITPETSVPTSINLSPSAMMDISFLSEEERKAVLMDHTKGMLDITKKAQELHVDSAALKKTLDDLSDATKQVADSDTAVSLTHTQTTSVGRTEVIMGNTEQAHSGRLSKSQTGEKDWTPFYIIGGIIALVLIFAGSK